MISLSSFPFSVSKSWTTMLDLMETDIIIETRTVVTMYQGERPLSVLIHGTADQRGKD